ncbi:hypothetical protein PtA15_11A506 [Puccinia triticina]|uniref:Uncharacterized protein n=1 Tax=Puccinia triticina TaxID=208348 RepID=A0ABY7CXZ3_9BASI|nr:uncharacterized protein PtA15_11A506 [Puccinia triticina]WAQ89815.1 hypothetical protein PtA15_11A506 [Puccinia triticina]
MVPSDSEVEVLSSSTLSKAAAPKRSNDEAFSPRNTGFPKRVCVDRMPCAEFATAHPGLLSDASKTPYIEPSRIPDNQPSSSIATSVLLIEPLTRDGRIKNSLKSATVAFDRVKEVLKKKMDRKEMAKRSSTSRMHEFQLVCYSLLRMVEERVPGICHTMASSFPGVADTSGLNGAEMAVLVCELAEVGWAALKRIDGLLKAKAHSKAFIGNSDELSMILFEERLFELVGMLENANMLAPRKQIR